jgi:pyrroloquinoline quinone (PQQ) biosynthesis protein C
MDKNDTDQANDGAREKLTEAVRGSYEAAVESTAAMQESNTRLARSFFEGSIEALEAQAEVSRHTLQSVAQLAREQQEAFQELSRRSLDAYDGFLDSLFSYYKEVLGPPTEETDDRL